MRVSTASCAAGNVVEPVSPIDRKRNISTSLDDGKASANVLYARKLYDSTVVEAHRVSRPLHGSAKLDAKFKCEAGRTFPGDPHSMEMASYERRRYIRTPLISAART